MDKWLERLFDRFLRGATRNNPDGSPSFHRWRLLPFNWPCVLIHEFVSDDPYEPHSHPQGFISIGWRGSYIDSSTINRRRVIRTYHAPFIRRVKSGSDYKHRVCLINRKPCWTLAIMSSDLCGRLPSSRKGVDG